MSTATVLGDQLRGHRKQRGLSQLDLAAIAESTPRYISFIESGRSRPGREILLRIAKALNLTLRDTNALLVAAGLPAAFMEPNIEDEQMAPVRHIISQVLKQHEPFPAWVIGPGLQFLESNEAAERVFPGLVGTNPRDLITGWCCGSQELGEAAQAETVFQILHGLRSEAFHHPHPILPELIALAESFAVGLKPPPPIADSPVMGSKLVVAGKQVNTLATVMRFDKVMNVTMAEIRIELVFPADPSSEAVFREIALGSHV